MQCGVIYIIEYGVETWQQGGILDSQMIIMGVEHFSKFRTSPPPSKETKLSSNLKGTSEDVFWIFFYDY